MTNLALRLAAARRRAEHIDCSRCMSGEQEQTPTATTDELLAATYRFEREYWLDHLRRADGAELIGEAEDHESKARRLRELAGLLPGSQARWQCAHEHLSVFCSSC